MPDFNIGTNSGASCDAQLAERLVAVCADAPAYRHILNGRFKGGYITRHYGQPQDNVHAVQLELAQCNYMDEHAPFGYREDLAAPTARYSGACWKPSSPGAASTTAGKFLHSLLPRQGLSARRRWTTHPGGASPV